MSLEVTNSQTFEERSHVLLAAIETAEDATFHRLAEVVKAHRGSGALNKILTEATKRNQAGGRTGGNRLTELGDAIMINDAKISTTDIVASNVVMHVIDTVALPPAM
jgi:hypothetical protein